MLPRGGSAITNDYIRRYEVAGGAGRLTNHKTLRGVAAYEVPEGTRAFMAIIGNNRLAVSTSNAMIGGVGSKAKLMPMIGSCELAKDVK
ncbi:hypothetical protein Tco_0201076 [Tanacetum coccineum]